MTAMFISFREKEEKIQSARKQAIYITDVLKMQIEYFKEKELKLPFDAESELAQAEGLIKQFDEIYRDKSGTPRERHERKTMIVGFEDIFTDLNEKIGELIREMHSSFETQCHEKA